MNKKMNKYKWVFPENDVKGSFLERVVKSRFGLDVDQNKFLNPKYDLGDPFLLPDMSKATKRIKEAIKNDEKIVIFGDYDVDGVTSCAMLWEVFSFLGKEVQIYIPDRFDEGYGLKESSLRNLKSGGVDLVITVDCGIRDAKLIRKMSEEGLDIIVTDHHNVGDKTPECVAVVNPKRNTNEYPEKNLAGVGVAYGLARALLVEMGIEERKKEWFEKWNLDLVAMGTVADMMPLVGENRILVYYGLKVLSQTKKKGIRRILEIAEADISKTDSKTIGFVLGPRLNAAGRLDNAMLAFDLLTENEDLEINMIANNLDEKNRKRRTVTDEIIKEIVKSVDVDNLPPVFVMAKEGWSRGVIGLVASRMMDRYYRPAFLAEIDDDKVVGSARGIEGVNVVEVLEGVSDLLDHFGGHSMAGGFSLKKSNWEDFVERVNNDVKKRLDGRDLQRELNVDLEVRFDELGHNLWNEWPKLEPFGMGNQEPIFVSKGIKIINNKIIGKTGAHLKIDVMSGNEKKVLLWWGGAENIGEFDESVEYDIAYKLNFNEYNGRRSIDLILEDIRVAEL